MQLLDQPRLAYGCPYCAQHLDELRAMERAENLDNFFATVPNIRGKHGASFAYNYRPR
jgi:hypothetical protein